MVFEVLGVTVNVVFELKSLFDLVVLKIITLKSTRVGRYYYLIRKSNI